MLRNPSERIEQVFGHRLNGKEIKINVTKLREHMEAVGTQKVEIELSESLIQKLIANNGVERHRLTRLLALSDEEFSALPPPIVISFRDHDWVLADGNHTVCAAYYRESKKPDPKTTVAAFRARPKVWQKFEMTDDRKIPYFGFSGIL